MVSALFILRRPIKSFVADPIVESYELFVALGEPNLNRRKRSNTCSKLFVHRSD